MIPEVALRDALLADPAVAELVGRRFYPHDDLPQAPTLPAMTYQRVGRPPSSLTMDRQEGPGGPRVQLNCVASTYGGAWALAREVMRVLGGGLSVEGGLQLARLEGSGDLPRDAETRLFGVRLDVLVTMGAAEAA